MYVCVCVCVTMCVRVFACVCDRDFVSPLRSLCVCPCKLVNNKRCQQEPPPPPRMCVLYSTHIYIYIGSDQGGQMGFFLAKI